jgi:twin arginine-targeting protein translocase, TatA/E family
MFFFVSLQKLQLKRKIMFGLGTAEILVIALIILLLFGGRKIPELMKGLGKGVKSFKDGMKEVEKDVDINDEKKEEVKQE